MANLTPTEMVATDQLYKSALQRVNANIADKQAYIETLTCTYPSYRFNTIVSENNAYTMSTCTNCPIESICKSKEAIETAVSEVSELLKTKTTLTQKYSQLQDDIETYLKS